MLSSVLWPSDKPRDETDYDFVYPMHLNISEQGQLNQLMIKIQEFRSASSSIVARLNHKA